MDACELVAMITTVACGIAKCASDDELELLAAAFTQLGDTLVTILTKRGMQETKCIDHGNKQVPKEKEDRQECTEP